MREGDHRHDQTGQADHRPDDARCPVPRFEVHQRCHPDQPDSKNAREHRNDPHGNPSWP
ncbi:hypothetical protein J7E99_05280 [Streptomyces sp. ISL-44]|uniref:hypothetical protein n=1 Tax=Streptomyces sp. ISL-44 TaxID=2819184 RepID=UPI001BE7D50B|nr:hypothetical protein [Streptomyces sp. ISL-44]MBT2540131.1 hypothetical protein [Streptomyces sp. ISL-44]